MGAMECMHGFVPGMLLSDSIEPDLSHTSILYCCIRLLHKLECNHLMKKYSYVSCRLISRFFCFHFLFQLLSLAYVSIQNSYLDWTERKAVNGTTFYV